MIEFGTAAFWIALLQIIGINIVLSGDNAVVIALAARSLPMNQQRKAVFWGSSAAVAMRIVLTVVAVELLKLPVLKLIGAVLLLWIAVQLLLPEEEGAAGAEPVSSMAAAIRTILLADLVMSLDNVIGVAAAAKGSLPLLVIGLALSIPLVIFASTFLLSVMERFPVIVTLGAALLGYVAGEMAVSDPLVMPWIGANATWLHTAVPAVGVVLVLGIGKLLAARVEAAEEGRPVVDLADLSRIGSTEEASMHRLLIPIDGSDASLRAVERLLEMRRWYREPLEIHLLNVQHPLHRDVGQFVAAEDVMGYHMEEGRKTLAGAIARMEKDGVPCQHHVVIGDLPAETIAHFCREKGIGQIFMCSHCRPAVGDLLLGSVAKGVLQHSDLPVTLVRR